MSKEKGVRLVGDGVIPGGLFARIWSAIFEHPERELGWREKVAKKAGATSAAVVDAVDTTLKRRAEIKKKKWRKEVGLDEPD